jgi:hypothetical protein
MFSVVLSSEKEGSSQHPVPSHTPTQNVQQALDIGQVSNVASNASGPHQRRVG